MSSDQRAVALTAAAATAITVAVVMVPALRFAAVAPDLRIAMDMAQGMVGGLVAYLLVGWYRRTKVVNHLALAYAFALAGGTNLALALQPALTDAHRGGAFSSWAPLATRTISTLVLALTALVADRRTPVRHPVRRLFVSLALTAVAVALVFVPLAPQLPAGVEVLADPTGSTRPRLQADPVLEGLQLVMFALYAAAAAGFLRRARNGEGGLMRTLAIACTIGAFSRVNYFLYPSIYSDVVHLGDFFRLAYFLVLLVGAAREINDAWVAQTESMAIAERQRLARDLHDGLTQDLAFIRSHASSLAAGRGSPEMLEHVATAAGRALDESRRVVSALTAPVGGTLADVLEHAARTASREGAAVTVDVPAIDVSPILREHLAWVTREAVGNAVRHGRARAITVEGRIKTGHVHVVVVDNGDGFDPVASNRRPGAGLTGMRQRIAALDGRLELISPRPDGRGTSVEICVPLAGGAQRPAGPSGPRA